MKPPEDAPLNPIDSDIAEAFAALDGTLAEGALDDFSSRVLARLGDRAAGSEPGREDSGLHDIMALASSARRRLSERDGSEADGDDSAVLLTAAQGGLRAVALPDPKKGRGAAIPGAGGRAETASEAARRADARSSAPFWILGSVASLAAAAAVAVFVFGIGRPEQRGEQEPDERLARTEGAAATPGSGPGGAPASSGQPALAPPPPPPPAVSAPAVVGGPGPASRAKPERDRGVRRERKSRDASKDAPEERAAEPVDTAEVETATPGVVTPGPTGGDALGGEGAEAPAGQGRDAGGSASLEDMLDEATGQRVRPAPDPEAAKKVEDVKKELDRRDVSAALEGIQGEVRSCRELDGASGTVSVRFVVAPTGQVSSSQATGAHARSRTGSCVAGAVKGARFPAFEGAPVSFTYPFLLDGAP